MGGAMHYLSEGLKEKIGRSRGFLAGLFCLLCIGGSLGGGNAFQVVQSLDLIKTVIPGLEHYSWIYGVLMSVLVGLVIVGGIKSISCSLFVVPFMCTIYLIACSFILLTHVDAIPKAPYDCRQAFSPMLLGGFLGVLIIGIKRAVLK